MPDEISPQTTQFSLHPSRSIQEFRIDYLLEEEFNVDPEFVRHFVGACGSNLVPGPVLNAVRSVTDGFGEADLVVRMGATNAAGAEVVVALLIEDKITAPPQPEQPERYRMRGKYGRDISKEWDLFLTVLVAPHAYIGSDHGYDAAISLEDIEAWICPDDPARRKYKVQAIKDAIAKKNTTGVKVVDPYMTAFRADYYAALQEFNTAHGTDFRMRPPKDTYYGDYWFELKSNLLPDNAEIRHVPRSGHLPYTAFIELTFKNTALEKSAGLEGLRDSDMSLIATGTRDQHVAIRLPAPSVAVFDDFARDKEKVLEAFLSAARLVRFYQANRARIDPVLASARVR